MKRPPPFGGGLPRFHYPTELLRVVVLHARLLAIGEADDEGVDTLLGRLQCRDPQGQDLAGVPSDAAGCALVVAGDVRLTVEVRTDNPDDACLTRVHDANSARRLRGGRDRVRVRSAVERGGTRTTVGV